MCSVRGLRRVVEGFSKEKGGETTKEGQVYYVQGNGGRGVSGEGVWGELERTLRTRVGGANCMVKIHY